MHFLAIYSMQRSIKIHSNLFPTQPLEIQEEVKLAVYVFYYNKKKKTSHL